jgi:hypothetical protein
VLLLMFPIRVVKVRLVFLDPPDVVVIVEFPIFVRVVILIPLAVLRFVMWELDAFAGLNFLTLGNAFIFFIFAGLNFVIFRLLLSSI